MDHSYCAAHDQLPSESPGEPSNGDTHANSSEEMEAEFICELMEPEENLAKLEFEVEINGGEGSD